MFWKAIVIRFFGCEETNNLPLRATCLVYLKHVAYKEKNITPMKSLYTFNVCAQEGDSLENSTNTCMKCSDKSIVYTQTELALLIKSAIGTYRVDVVTEQNNFMSQLSVLILCDN